MKTEVLNLIKGNLIEIMPELEGQKISFDDSFVDLGANSIDRGELITLTLERMEMSDSRVDFVNAKSINELAELILKKQKA
jgi:polyketide biosynthesis acyl carrier protein